MVAKNDNGEITLDFHTHVISIAANKLLSLIYYR